ncbi:hypothetical protein I3843_14G098300 [Carya illinoinensis]|nr:hypothetical protein I3843_14G098300 [Carya illinoinensis]
MDLSIRKQNCINTNIIMRTPIKPMIGTITQYVPRNISKRAAEKAIIMVAIKKKRVKRPIIIFLGKNLRKYSFA